MNWTKSSTKCPICENEMEEQIGTLDEYDDCVLAERCPHCRIVIRFDNLDEDIKAEKY